MTKGPKPKALGAAGPFRAEDFDFDVTIEGVEGCRPESRHLADAANARLAPLFEALEDQSRIAEIRFSKRDEDMTINEAADLGQADHECRINVLAAYRALRGEKP